MIFEFGNFCIDADVERTRAFYETNAKTVIEDCGCVNCRNYYEAISKVSDKVKNFFNSLGIDPQKSPEATWLDTNEDCVAYYSIIFHVVGTIIKSVDIYKPVGDSEYQLINENFYEIDKGFKVGFTTKADLVEKDFPRPCIQLEVMAHLPWLIN